MQMCLERNFGFNYLSWSGRSSPASASSIASGRSATRSACPGTRIAWGFCRPSLSLRPTSEPSSGYAQHLEYGFRKGLGSIPPEKLGLPGGIDIRGVQALVKDPGDFGLYYKMRGASFRELVDAGVVIVGKPGDRPRADPGVLRGVRHRKPPRDARLGSLPRDLAMKNIQLFAGEVAPYLRDLWTDTEHVHHWWPERLGGAPTPLTHGARATDGAAATNGRNPSTATKREAVTTR